jgi:hypothetical protein
MDLFQKYALWRILRHFAMAPRTRVNVKEVARATGLSMGSCSRILAGMERDGFMHVERLGRACYYSLADTYLTRELRRFVGLAEVHASGLAGTIAEQVPDLVSCAVHGSFAKGDFDEGSDLDAVVIAPGAPKPDVANVEAILGREVSVESFSLGDWLKLKGKGDPFYRSVLDSHVLLCGGPLP